jgi:hypothetical protein
MTFMRRAATLATLAFLAACIEDRTEVRTITLDYLTSAQALALAGPYLSPDGKLFSSDAALNTITVRDRRDNVRQIQNLLNQRDASPQNVSLRFQVVRATKTGAVDPELARVSGALRELLRFEGYELVAQTVVSASERRVVEQSLSGGAFPLQLGVRINDITGGSGSVDMQVDLRREGYPSLLATNVVVPMGQTVVLGSAYPGTTGEALILTVRGELGSTKLRSSSRRTRDGARAEDAAHAEAVAAEAAAVEAMRAHEQAVFDADIAAREIIDSHAKSTVIGGKASTEIGAKLGRDEVRIVVPPAKAARARSGAVPPDDAA